MDEDTDLCLCKGQCTQTLSERKKKQLEAIEEEEKETEECETEEKGENDKIEPEKEEKDQGNLLLDALRDD